ncbi:VapC toxin family PIN domain ribonuclease [Thiohalocapsa halophila]|uniref:Ribonuclease VapC n=1 Tax=Thiohalocapsa halophila TaxID=69359 RepID=A0ABS1CKJ1_9GAMM|nr:type II toxin-antitoxin system VapC family toxin [Thiohalocapsa halophila]MBK1631974.1 VapC toxin family PIN domain ribonuclease [Thiohalocapsa halophila]
MRFLLDTDTCIYVINRKPPAVMERFRQLALGDVGVSSITAAELAFGVAKSGSARNRTALEKFLAPLEILPFGMDAVWVYGQVRAALEHAGTPIGSLDTLIAAHALAGKLTLITNNLREFERVHGLRCENWVNL